MIVHQPEIQVQNGEVCVSARVETRNRYAHFPKILFYKFPERYAENVTDRADAFAAGLLLVAMNLGEDLHIRGSLSPRLFYGMEEYRNLFSVWWPDLFKPVNIESEVLEPLSVQNVKKGVISTFSGGVDSLHTLWRSLPQNQPIPGARVTHGLFIQGFDIPLSQVDKFNQLREKFEALYAGLGLDLISAKTNLREFFVGRIEISKCQSALLSSAALTLSPLISRLYIPSTGADHYVMPHGTSLVGDRLFSTETLEVFHHCATYTRFEKYLEIADWDIAQNHLRVCLDIHGNKSENCSNCWKCYRTMIDLDVLGKLEQFSVFRHPLTVMDYIRWGRWMKVGYGFEKTVLKHCWKVRKELLFPALMGISVGYFRDFLLKVLPQWVQLPIQRLVSPPKTETLFVTTDAGLSDREGNDDH